MRFLIGRCWKARRRKENTRRGVNEANERTNVKAREHVDRPVGFALTRGQETNKETRKAADGRPKPTSASPLTLRSPLIKDADRQWRRQPRWQWRSWGDRRAISWKRESNWEADRNDPTTIRLVPTWRPAFLRPRSRIKAIPSGIRLSDRRVLSSTCCY